MHRNLTKSPALLVMALLAASSMTIADVVRIPEAPDPGYKFAVYATPGEPLFEDIIPGSTGMSEIINYIATILECPASQLDMSFSDLPVDKDDTLSNVPGIQALPAVNKFYVSGWPHIFYWVYRKPENDATSFNSPTVYTFGKALAQIAEAAGYDKNLLELRLGTEPVDLKMRMKDNAQFMSNKNLEYSREDTVVVPGVANDPLITGFDNKKFHFDQLGDFSLFKEGGGWTVDATFAGANVTEGQEMKEKSWTSAVRVISPDGGMISCTLPAITPNTSKVKMVATPADTLADPVLLSASHTTVELPQMKGTAVLTWKKFQAIDYAYVVACQISTPKFEVLVYQVSGYEEALAKPDEHGWAAPFTWLNVNFKIIKELAAPVTGILGDTYPKETDPLTFLPTATAQATTGLPRRGLPMKAEDVQLVQERRRLQQAAQGRPFEKSPPLLARVMGL